MSDDEASETRRARLAARRKRYRWAGIFVAAVIVGAAGTVAAFAVTEEPHDDGGSDASPAEVTTTTTGVLDNVQLPDFTAPETEEFAFRPLSHDEPLKLWVGGDS